MTTPKFIYGTAWKKEQTTLRVLTAWQAGFRAFDTACQPKHYREDLVGDALVQLMAEGNSRSDFYLQTKFTPVSGQDEQTIPYNPSLPLSQQVEASFKDSQKNLHTDYVDALILHSPISPFEHTLEAWQAMENIHYAGSAKQLGISNCYDFNLFKHLYKTVEVKPSIVQNRFYAKTDYDKNLRTFCLAQGIEYQSFWTLTANPHILEHATLMWLTRRLRKTPAQILFRYLIQRGVTPLTGTCDQEHMQEDLAVFEFELSEDDLSSIDAVLN